MGISIEWVGTDGSVWDLRQGPVKLSTEGIKGFGLPEFDDQVITSPLRDGQRFVGFKLKPRTVYLPFRFKDAAANDVEGLQRAFWRALAPGEYGTLRVTDGNGGVRQLECRIQDDDSKVYRFDPYDLDPDVIGLTLIADIPWWRSPLNETTYRVNQGGTANFFGGGDPSQPGFATPFVISSASGSSALIIDNPGDAPSWTLWRISGGTSSAFRLGANGHYISSNINLGAADVLEIDTDPTRQTALLNGELVPFKSFTEIDFAPFPKGQGFPLTIEITGSALVSASGYFNYMRAF